MYLDVLRNLNCAGLIYFLDEHLTIIWICLKFICSWVAPSVMKFRFETIVKYIFTEEGCLYKFASCQERWADSCGGYDQCLAELINISQPPVQLLATLEIALKLVLYVAGMLEILMKLVWWYVWNIVWEKGFIKGKGGTERGSGGWEVRRGKWYAFLFGWDLKDKMKEIIFLFSKLNKHFPLNSHTCEAEKDKPKSCKCTVLYVGWKHFLQWVQ